MTNLLTDSNLEIMGIFNLSQSLRNLRCKDIKSYRSHRCQKLYLQNFPPKKGGKEKKKTKNPMSNPNVENPAKMCNPSVNHWIKQWTQTLKFRFQTKKFLEITKTWFTNYAQLNAEILCLTHMRTFPSGQPRRAVRTLVVNGTSPYK